MPKLKFQSFRSLCRWRDNFSINVINKNRQGTLKLDPSYFLMKSLLLQCAGKSAGKTSPIRWSVHLKKFLFAYPY